MSQQYQNSFLLPMAIGDAFGMKYEFVEHPIPITSRDIFYGNHPRFEEYHPAHYTDDTQKALANGELLLKKNAASITRRDFIEAWLEVFHRDHPRQGYSRHMFKVMCNSATHSDFSAAIDPSKGVTSGAAMGASPLGLLPNIDAVIKTTRLQASITHDTPAGVNSALAVALATHFFHHGGKGERLSSFLGHKLGVDWCSPAKGLTDDPNNGLKIVCQALTSLNGARSFSQILVAGASQDKIADTDTICAVAMAIASRQPLIHDDLPTHLYTNLENGNYGANYLRSIDAKLMRKFPRSDIYASFGP